jgi:bifunctional UDP-N-acetylglucosamine pyrophosphorylase/glucosamine-1-phosphate N-acetyltransferase
MQILFKLQQFTPFLIKSTIVFMDHKVFFIDSEYSTHLVAAKMIKQFAQDTISCSKLKTFLPHGSVLLIKTNLIGLTDEIIESFAQKKKDYKAIIGLVDSEPCIALVDVNLLNDSSPDINLFYNNIDPKWSCCTLDSFELKLLNSNSKVVSFGQEIQKMLREEAINKGVYLEDPNTIYLSYDTTFGKGVLIEPNVYFGPKVRIDNNVHIRAFSYLEGVEIERESKIGPFVRIRGETKIDSNVKIGNFVEIKNSTFGTGSKASHLSYIGDATIGSNVNIGAGVVTCNYDGLKKHKTIIKNNSFIGSNSSLISPITIGCNTLIGASSFINKDVPDDTFAIGRSQQLMKPNRRK